MAARRDDKGKEKEAAVEAGKKMQVGGVGAAEGVTSPGELTVFVSSWRAQRAVRP
jgi:hypothetical protein